MVEDTTSSEEKSAFVSSSDSSWDIRVLNSSFCVCKSFNIVPPTAIALNIPIAKITLKQNKKFLQNNIHPKILYVSVA